MCEVNPAPFPTQCVDFLAIRERLDLDTLGSRRDDLVRHGRLREETDFFPHNRKPHAPRSGDVSLKEHASSVRARGLGLPVSEAPYIYKV